MDRLKSFTAHNTARRLDMAQRHLDSMAWLDGAGQTYPLNQTTIIRGEQPVNDKWAVLQRDGFYQDEDGLRHMPVLVYPGIVLDDFTVNPITPQPNAKLYVRIAYQLGRNGRGGWNGAITSAKASLHWGEPPANIIFPGTYADSLPPNDTFVWHYHLGQTDDAGTYSRSLATLNYACGQLIPPL